MKLLKHLTGKDIVAGITCFFLIFLEVWLGLKMPDYTRALTVEAAGGGIRMELVRYNGGMMLLCALGVLLISCIISYLTARIAASFTHTLRGLLFEKITGFSDMEYNRFTTASLITRTTEDVLQMYMLICTGLQLIVRAPITAGWAIMKMAGAGAEWTEATAIAVIVMFLCIGVLIAVCIPRFKLSRTLTDDMNHVTGEGITGVRVVRAFNAESFLQKRFDSANDGLSETGLFTGRVMSLMSPVMSICLSGLMVVIYWIGAVQISRAVPGQRADILGSMVVFTQYAMQVVMAFMMLSFVLVILPKVSVAAKRISEVLETENALSYPSERVECSEQGRVEFRNVSFSYTGSGKPCLSGLSFEINSGETFAVIGSTGAGKTSLVSLIPRLYDVTEGQVLVDGADVRSFPKEQLEKIISVATQKAVIFTGDIKANVAYGQTGELPEDDPRLIRALEAAQADFAFSSPEGLRQSVSQGGSNLSGGQMQRLSIARALFKDSEIYIFDDTFSALDFRTDKLLRRALRTELEGRTVIIVAQRIGTVMNADRILVLNEGKAVGLGTHRELLESCPVYREIALSQLSEEELAHG